MPAAIEMKDQPNWSRPRAKARSDRMQRPWTTATVGASRKQVKTSDSAYWAKCSAMVSWLYPLAVFGDEEEEKVAPLASMAL